MDTLQLMLGLTQPFEEECVEDVDFYSLLKQQAIETDFNNYELEA